jgi:hypothetical protein
MNTYIFVSEIDVLWRIRMPGTVHREHSSPFTAAERSVVGVVIEHENIAGFGFEGDVAGELAGSNAKEFL